MILFFVLIGVLLFLFMLLSIPIEIEYSYDSRSGLKSGTQIVWLFGLLRFQPKRKKEDEPGDELRHQVPSKQTSRKPVKADNKGFEVLLALFCSEGFIRRFFRLLYAVLTITRIKQLRARLLLGLDDPADTGLVYGLLMPCFSFLYAVPRVEFVATPVFDRYVVESNLQMKICMVPIRYLKAIVFFLFSLETFRAAKAAYKAYRQ